jgi:hypothetical protein
MLAGVEKILARFTIAAGINFTLNVPQILM